VNNELCMESHVEDESHYIIVSHSACPWHDCWSAPELRPCKLSNCQYSVLIYVNVIIDVR